MKKKIFLSLAAIALLAVLTVTVVYAFFSKKTDAGIDAEYHRFRVTPAVWFDGLTEETTAATYRDANGFYSVDYFDMNADNYVGKLRVSLKYEGQGEAFVRVGLLEFWTDADSNILRMPYTKYAAGENFIDGRTHSGYFYYHIGTGLDGFAVKDVPESGKTEQVITGLKDGFAWSKQADGTALKVRIVASAVQKNRYSQLWNITEAELLALLS